MKTAHILMVEDNEGDILLTTEAFDGKNFVNKISVVRNGKDALDFIFQRGKFTDADLPDLILLDINLPFKNGHEILESIKSNKCTQHIPVIMLTTSSSPQDILSTSKYTNKYITKPLDVSEFAKVVNTIEVFWNKIVKSPNASLS